MINIIIGPPCAGKSTHIREQAKAGDVLIDYDQIATAIGSDVPHQAKGDIRKVALSMRHRAIDEITKGIDADSWIIHSNPSPLLLARYEEAGATFTMIDPGQADCIERASDRPEGTADAIADWYANPPTLPQGDSIDDPIGK